MTTPDRPAVDMRPLSEAVRRVYLAYAQAILTEAQRREMEEEFYRRHPRARIGRYMRRIVP